MGVYRMFTGDDGETHIEELSADAVKEIKLEGAQMNFSVSQREPGHFSDYHPAPRRRWQVGVVGRTIIGLSDGTSHEFGPGDVRLIEDLTGRGHTTTPTRTALTSPCRLPRRRILADTASKRGQLCRD